MLIFIILNSKYECFGRENSLSGCMLSMLHFLKERAKRCLTRFLRLILIFDSDTHSAAIPDKNLSLRITKLSE